MRIIGIIPARYASTRLPGKPLLMVGDTSLIMRVYKQCLKSNSLEDLYVATDNERIEEHVINQGGKVIMTAPDHESGTERCFEALTKIEEKTDYVINIQGDEPFISPLQIDLLSSICDGNTEIATLYKKINENKELWDVNIPKVVLGEDGRAIYFSRSAVPHQRGLEDKDWLNGSNYFKHIGIYAYRTDTLATISKMKPSRIERMEQLEQLRWLANGIGIRAMETTVESLSVDTEKDLKAANEFLIRQ